MAHLFSPLKIRDVVFKNRIFVSPMCQYSATDGIPNDWHLVHLGSRAVGGAALVICEATSICPEGRISNADLGLWNQDQEKAFLKITDFIHAQGSIAGIQLAHAGRKAATPVPWLRESGNGFSLNWEPVAPSAIAFSPDSQVPRELKHTEIEKICQDFEKAAESSFRAGFKVLEIHMAHGYLLHEFLSPVSNQRNDLFGGSIENRMRLPLMVAQRVREKWPKSLPLFVRISATDWLESESWTLQDSIKFCQQLKSLGVDLIDCSSGGIVTNAHIKIGPGYQVQFSKDIREQSQIMTGAVGMITNAFQAEEILSQGLSDAILIGREFLRSPYWPLYAAKDLGVNVKWPVQYERGRLE